MPAVILSYANDENNFLSWLEDEFKAINSYFINYNAREVEVIALPNVSLERLREVLAARAEEIILFHFSGHSDKYSLLFENKKPGGGPGLAQMLGTAPNLKFVFLNGCANKEHVAKLHEAKIPAVIATSRKIDDKLAAEFAISFYSSLCRHNILTRAFDLAKSFILADSKIANFLPNSSRHLGALDNNENKDSDIPWGIYYKAYDNPKETIEIQNSIENWTLPERGILPDRVEPQYNPCYHFIKKIVEKAGGYFGDLRDQNNNNLDDSFLDEITSLLRYYQNEYDETPFSFRELSDRVKDIMPYPLATKLEKILQKGNEINDELLDGQVIAGSYYELLTLQLAFYQTLIKLCGITMLSDLYNFLLGKTNKNEITITQGQYERIESFFLVTQDNKDEYDYTSLVKSIREVLEINGIKPFIEEYEVFKENFTHNKTLFEAHMEISSLKYRLTAGKLNESAIKSYCNKAEKLLWEVFEQVYFVLRYKLVVIARIEILKYRIDTPKFVHSRIILYRSKGNYLPEDDVILPQDGVSLGPAYTDSYSVMLFRGLSDFSSYLNLSPFAIDLNILKGDQASLLYLYSHIDSKNEIVYEEVKNPKINISLSINSDGSIDYVKNLKKPPKIERKITAKFTNLYKQFEVLKANIEELKLYTKKED